MLTETLRLILAGLASYRLAFAIAREDGPFDVLANLRERVDQNSWVGRGLRCVLCLSFWISLPAAIVALSAAPTLIDFLLVWGGIAGGILVAHRAGNG